MSIQRLPVTVVMPSVALLLFAAFTTLAEKIPLRNGLGYDGVGYAAIARNIGALLTGSLPLDALTFNRFLPSLLCGLTLHGLGISPTDQAIVAFFAIYNMLLLTAGAFLWASISTLSGFSVRGCWLGFLAIFCSHASLKYNIYYSVITDVTALSLGLVMLWAFLQRRNLLVAVATVLGSATWPTLLPVGLLLLVFPARPMPPSPPAPRRTALFLTMLLLLVSGCYLHLPDSLQPGTVAPLAGAAVLVVVIVPALFLLCNTATFFSLRTLLPVLSPWRLLFAGGLTVAVLVTLREITGNNSSILTLATGYFFQIIQIGLRFPGEFLIAHTLYYGPWVLLLVLHFSTAAQVARNTGLGMVLVCALAVVQSITPLSRQLIAVMPFLAFLCVAAMDKQPCLMRRFLFWFAVVSLIVSKAWMRFSTDPGNPEGTFSFDWYVSSTGAWMTFPFYWIQGLFVAALTCWLWMLCRAPRAVAASR